MNNEEGFEEVVPGVLVNKSSGFKVSIPHPDPCWVIRNPEKTATMVTKSGSLAIFSDEEKANTYMKDWKKEDFVLEAYGWDDLVDKFGKQFADAIVDHSGEPGFYQNVPLKKGI
jgi:hypothetical protein